MATCFASTLPDPGEAGVGLDDVDALDEVATDVEGEMLELAAGAAEVQAAMTSATSAVANFAM
jgi:hypothetical protein